MNKFHRNTPSDWTLFFPRVRSTGAAWEFLEGRGMPRSLMMRKKRVARCEISNSDSIAIWMSIRFNDCAWSDLTLEHEINLITVTLIKPSSFFGMPDEKSNHSSRRFPTRRCLKKTQKKLIRKGRKKHETEEMGDNESYRAMMYRKTVKASLSSSSSMTVPFVARFHRSCITCIHKKSQSNRLSS